MWISSPDDMSGEAWIQFPFDTAYQLQEIQIWNYNEDIEPILGFGFNETVIEYSTNDPEAEEKTWIYRARLPQRCASRQKVITPVSMISLG